MVRCAAQPSTAAAAAWAFETALPPHALQSLQQSPFALHGLQVRACRRLSPPEPCSQPGAPCPEPLLTPQAPTRSQVSSVALATMRAALAALFVALLAVGAAPAAAQLPATIQTLLEKPELRPFINKVRGQR